MRDSTAVADALTTFFAKNASGDLSTYGEVVSKENAVLAIGSTAREWFVGQVAVRGAYGIEGVLIDPGEIAAWENGNTGWAVARPRFTVPGGPSFRLRFTAVFLREGDTWKLMARTPCRTRRL